MTAPNIQSAARIERRLKLKRLGVDRVDALVLCGAAELVEGGGVGDATAGDDVCVVTSFLGDTVAVWVAIG